MGSRVVLRNCSTQSFGHGFQVESTIDTAYFPLSVLTNLQDSKQYLSISIQVRSPSTDYSTLLHKFLQCSPDLRMANLTKTYRDGFLHQNTEARLR